MEVSPSQLVDQGAVQRSLRLAGVSRDVTASVVNLLNQLAVVGFADPRTRTGERIDGAMVETLMQRVDAEALPVFTARRRVGARVWRLPWLMLLVSAAGTLVVTPQRVAAAQATLVSDSVSHWVEQATTAHRQEDFPRAAQWWARAVHQRPRDVILLVNWGESAWRSGDTVMTVVAWHRALREAPVDAALRAVGIR